MTSLFEWLGPICAVCENRLRFRDVFRFRFGLGILCPHCNSRLHTPLWVAFLTVIPFYWLLGFYPRYVRPLYGSPAVFAFVLVVYLIAFVFLAMLPVRWHVVTRLWRIAGLIALAVWIGFFVVIWIEYHVAS
jgi:hypothetical protein